VKIFWLWLMVLPLVAQEIPMGGGRGGPTATCEFLGLGAKLDGQNCAFCYSEKANGASRPDLVRSTVVPHEKDETIGPVLLQGRIDKPGQVRAIAEFLHRRVELTANRGTYGVQNIVAGAGKRGQESFAANCAAGEIVWSHVRPVRLEPPGRAATRRRT
jgi:hypothetical protein